MRQSRFTASQSVKVPKAVEGGAGDGGLPRVQHSDATDYSWKAKYGDMEDMKVSDIRRLKALEEENGRLKRLFVDLSLKHEALKDSVGKKR